MQEIIKCIGLIFANCFFGFLAVGGYLLQQDEYWHRIWEKLGQPEIESIKELKELKSKGVPDKK